eukprot:1301974-Amphidinium_carterae.1
MEGWQQVWLELYGFITIEAPPPQKLYHNNWGNPTKPHPGTKQSLCFYHIGHSSASQLLHQGHKPPILVAAVTRNRGNLMRIRKSHTHIHENPTVATTLVPLRQNR